MSWKTLLQRWFLWNEYIPVMPLLLPFNDWFSMWILITWFFLESFSSICYHKGATRVFWWARCLSCHPTVNVRAPRRTQSTKRNQQPGLVYVLYTQPDSRKKKTHCFLCLCLTAMHIHVVRQNRYRFLVKWQMFAWCLRSLGGISSGWSFVLITKEFRCRLWNPLFARSEFVLCSHCLIFIWCVDEYWLTAKLI